MSVQLPLGIRLRPSATFDGFVAGSNAEAVSCLKDQLGPRQSLYLWGAAGTGKSHLLQAACHCAAEQGKTSVYIPLAGFESGGPDLLDGLETQGLVCVDDVHMIAGLDAWELRLFHLFNELRERGGGIVLAGARPPGALGLGLPDLSTRLAWGPVFQLHALDDAQLELALRVRARALGMELPEEVARYLMHRWVRDTVAMFALLERLDQASLSAQRRLTIPFVRDIVESVKKQ